MFNIIYIERENTKHMCAEQMFERVCVAMREKGQWYIWVIHIKKGKVRYGKENDKGR